MRGSDDGLTRLYLVSTAEAVDAARPGFGTTTPATIVARWSARRVAATATVCDECGEGLDAGVTRCPQCRQAVGPTPTGMLATVVELAGGEPRLVVAERTPSGGWAAARVMPATPRAVQAIARQDLARGAHT